jgi:hypothetical protein
MQFAFHRDFVFGWFFLCSSLLPLRTAATSVRHARHMAPARTFLCRRAAIGQGLLACARAHGFVPGRLLCVCPGLF